MSVPIQTKTKTLNDSLTQPAINTAELAICNSYLEGETIEDIADKFNISEERVAAVLETKTNKKYIDVSIANTGNLHKKKLAEYTSTMIAQAAREGTSKDILDWLKFGVQLHENVKEKAPTTKVEINQVTKIEEAINRLTAKKQTVTVQGEVVDDD